MGLPSDDLIGFTTQVKQFLMDNKTALIAKDYDPTNDIARLGLTCATFGEEDGKQEAMKTTLKDQTDLVETLGYNLYTDTSSTLDAAVGKLGKTTAKGKEGAKIRSRLQGRTPRPPTNSTT